MKRIASLSIFFAALIEFAIERARFDLWIVALVAIVTLLWNVVGRALRLPLRWERVLMVRRKVV
jgi:hypothetical protein